VSALKHRFLGLCLPPLLLCALDATLTLSGQSPEYWSGIYTAVNEASPTMNHLLRFHPAAFVAGIFLWSAVFISVVLLLPDALALTASIALTFGHTAGAATWLYWRYPYGYQLCNGLFLLSAAVLAVCIRYGWQAEPLERYKLPFSTAVRWLLVLMIVAVAVYMYIWPRHAYSF
jgi:hypothetical protein